MKSPTGGPRKPVSSLAKNAIYGLLVATLLLGIGCLVASWVPYASVYEMLQRQYGSALTASRLTKGFYEQKQILVRIVGCLTLIGTGVVSWWRFALAEWLTADLYYLHRGWHRSLQRVRFALRRTEGSEVFDLVVLTTVGLIDRLFFLFQPVRFDEAVSYLDYASKPLYLLLSVYTEPENHIFNTLLVHFSTGAFGNHLWSLRLPALCAGTLMVPLAYLVGRQLYGRLPAIVAASLVATSSILIEYSTNARGYTVVGCCFLLLVLGGALALRKADPVPFLLLAVSTAVGFYAIPIMLFPAGGVLLWLILSVRKRPVTYRRTFWKLLATAAVAGSLLTAICYSPVFIVSGLKSVIANPYVKKLDFGSFLTRNATLLGETWQLWNRDLPLWGVILLLGGFALSVMLPFKNLNRHRRLIGAICLWCLLALTVFRFAPYPRVWLFLLPVYFLSAAAGWVYVSERLNRRWRGWEPTWRIVAFSLLGLLSLRNISRRSILDSRETGTCRNAEQAADFLIGNHIPIQQVFRTPVCNMPLIYYYLPRGGRELKDIRFLPVLEGIQSHDVTPEIPARDTRVTWVFVDSSQGDSLASVLHRDNLEGTKVLSKVEYEGGYLCQIQLAR